ncbi:BNot4 ring domain in complex with Ubc4 [Zalerion maritima]|uniref:BNot4 ring domain in complex with Ubc4 n=1 Tax=Zalerion maritima TaxID=339359 RepID=A0AAD5RW37_9PEZI|nr:BNot4 ring domain in complex with Ubc4 [Zalerion maritima]
MEPNDDSTPPLNSSEASEPIIPPRGPGTSDGASASRRLAKELRDYHRLQDSATESEQPLGYILEPKGDDIFLWKGTVIGPLGSPYAGGLFFFDISLPTDYPFKPPAVALATRMYHPILTVGQKVCMSFLCDDQWSPATTIMRVMEAIIQDFMININPDTSHIHNMEAATYFKNDRLKFDQVARDWTQRFAL